MFSFLACDIQEKKAENNFQDSDSSWSEAMPLNKRCYFIHLVKTFPASFEYVTQQ